MLISGPLTLTRSITNHYLFNFPEMYLIFVLVYIARLGLFIFVVPLKSHVGSELQSSANLETSEA